ncbi:MAG: homocysteine S-methyltransferase family protein [Oscillospiraceae bacterium]|nr:homocysteine S-methyltransferase family protein [Oscillospiraceae bacterium]
MKNNIKDLINKKILFFDGAMGTMLQENGLLAGELPESFNIERSEIVKNIHLEYLKSGCDIITTNTFGANSLKLKHGKYSVDSVVESAIKCAKDAILDYGEEDRFIAFDLGPLGQMMEPMGLVSFEEAYTLYSEQVILAEKYGVDLFLIETTSDLYEAKAAILACKEHSDKPIFCTLTFGDDDKTLLGADTLTVVTALEAFGVDVLGLNCSLGPKEMKPLIEEVLRYSSTPVMVQPNAGLPRIDHGKTVFDISPEEFSEHIIEMVEKGVSICGGCCGTTPDHIRATVHKCKDMIPKPRRVESFTALTSFNQTVIIGKNKRIIGERINPTGKKKLKEALINDDLDYILKEAFLQKDAGAHILDVNVGLPEIDEKKVMVKVVKEIQGFLNLPLQIDSARSDVLEAAVRIYNGKPLINSVNGKEESMKAIFPIAKKYGAAVLGLTLDENGIPKKAEDRFKIAQKIINKAAAYGIDKKDILIDALCLSASSNQEEVMETIKAIKMVKTLGVCTVLGLSNVSFGLPKRESLNSVFLSIALNAGLDAPILNPLNEDIIDAFMAYRVLADEDIGSTEYIKKFKGQANQIMSHELNTDLKSLLISGLRKDAVLKTKELLKNKQPLDIINEDIIPALNFVGDRFEKKELFLPELILSAEATKDCFNVLKEVLRSENIEKSSKKIILATVKGDIHDIGKNIVKILLENYGYEIIDLGKDVPIDTIVESALKDDIKLVGLSALMTTTVLNMEETIRELKKNCNCKIMVGGAVLNEKYAKMIDADFYGKDALDAVKIAQKVYNENGAY